MLLFFPSASAVMCEHLTHTKEEESPCRSFKHERMQWFRWSFLFQSASTLICETLINHVLCNTKSPKCIPRLDDRRHYRPLAGLWNLSFVAWVTSPKQGQSWCHSAFFHSDSRISHRAWSVVKLLGTSTSRAISLSWRKWKQIRFFKSNKWSWIQETFFQVIGP